MSPSYWYWESRTDDYISFVFYVSGSSNPGHLTRNGVHSTGVGVCPEFLLNIGEFIGNYSRMN